MTKAFDYHKPDDLDKACRLMAELPGAQVLAGGTDLLVDIDAGIRQAQHVISLKGISDLRRIQEIDVKVSIGAACTARAVELSPLIQLYFPEIVELVANFASPQVRTRATAGGNICSAVPCADFPVLLIALGAEVELVSPLGNRVLLLKDFFTGPRETVREKSEILARILVPKKPPTAATCYLKFQRRAANSLAVAGVAAFLDIQDGICRAARLVLGAVAPIPLLAEKANASLVGKKVDEEAIMRAAELARQEAEPITDIRGTAEYRRELIFVLTKRALKHVMGKIVIRK